MEKYIQYTSLDWLDDAEFMAYCKGGNPSFEEVVSFIKTQNQSVQDEFEEALSIGKAMSNIEPVSHTIDTQKLWNQIDQNTKVEAPKTKKVKIIPWGMYSAAASILLIISYFLFLNPESEKIASFATSISETKEVLLPDGSTMFLNENSTASYSETNWEKERKVNMNGEVFFKVEKGSKFSVLTDRETKVEVLGTEFLVSSRNEQENVLCTEGKVSVSNKQSKSVIVAGEKAVIENNNVLKSKTEPSNVTKKIGWVKGDFYFTNQPFKTIVSELEKQFNITIQIDESLDENRVYTGFFNNKNLEIALQSVCWPMNINYENVGNNTYKLSAK